jgi:tRNA dimethylallyltransferase
MRGNAILLMGPTAAGKTDLAGELVARFPLEIVSVDAAMVFRSMDIGTAKPGPELLARAPHHLIDVIDPAESYSAACFLADAEAAIRSIESRGLTPLLVGGTMLYFRAFQSGLARLPARDPEIRARLDARAAAEGWPALHAELARLDPGSASRIRPADRQRIQRALEVIERTGRPMSEQLAENLRGAMRREDLSLVIAPTDRAVLFERISRRFDAMLARGLLEEVARLRARGDLHPGLPAMRLIGYRQLWEHLEGATTLAQATQKAVTATRQLARRQLTWLRAEPGAEWFDPFHAATPERIAARIAEWFRERGIPARRC